MTSYLFKGNSPSIARLRNRSRLLGSYLKKRYIVGNMPIEMGLEVTNRCNLACIMCNRNDMHRPIGDVSRELVARVAREVKDTIELLFLHGTGEPLLHTNIFELIDICKQEGIAVGLSTNCVLLDKHRSRELLDAGIDYLILAVDGATKETYETVRRGAKYEQTMENIRYFLELRKHYARRPYVLLQYIVMPENRHETASFKAMWRNGSANAVRIRPEIDFLKRGNQRHGLASNHQRPCFYIFRSMNIYHDGSAVPCCADYDGKYLLGNVEDAPISELFNGRRMASLRRLHLEGKGYQVALCSQCQYPQPRAPLLFSFLLLNGLHLKKLLPNLEVFVTE